MKKFLLNILYIVRQLLDPFLRFREISVLCYHSSSNDSSETSVSAQVFERQLEVLKNAGYSFVSLNELITWYDNEVEDSVAFPRKAMALTFDDGYADFKTTTLPILEKYSAPATIFIVGDREGYRAKLGTNVPMLSDADIVELKKHPFVEVGWHTKTHPNLAALSKEEVVQEITPPVPMRFFAYPGGNYSNAVIEAVKQAGFSVAFSIKRDLVSRDKDRWLLPRIVVLKKDTGHDILQSVSMAQHWYAVLRSWFK